MKYKILVIDDEVIMRTVLERSLRAKGYEVEAFDSAEKALEWLKENLPDLVICDIQMEPMDGYTFLDEFRKRDYTRKTPVIMLSGIEGKKERVKSYGKTAQDFLSKPFVQDELDELIKKNLNPIYYKSDQYSNDTESVSTVSVRKRILVIEDDPTMRAILVKFLSGKNEVVSKGDGQEALEWLETNPRDLIICDIGMSPMDGYEFLQKFRCSGYTKHTPVMMLSGEDKTPERIKCYRAHAQDYLTKPFHPEELEALIQKNLFPVNYARKW